MTTKPEQGSGHYAREAAVRYAQEQGWLRHANGCAARYGKTYTCTCGLGKWLEQFQSVTQTQKEGQDNKNADCGEAARVCSECGEEEPHVNHMSEPIPLRPGYHRFKPQSAERSEVKGGDARERSREQAVAENSSSLQEVRRSSPLGRGMSSEAAENIPGSATRACSPEVSGEQAQTVTLTGKDFVQACDAQNVKLVTFPPQTFYVDPNNPDYLSDKPFEQPQPAPMGAREIAIDICAELLTSDPVLYAGGTVARFAEKIAAYASHVAAQKDREIAELRKERVTIRIRAFNEGRKHLEQWLVEECKRVGITGEFDGSHEAEPFILVNTRAESAEAEVARLKEASHSAGTIRYTTGEGHSVPEDVYVKRKTTASAGEAKEEK